MTVAKEKHGAEQMNQSQDLIWVLVAIIGGVVRVISEYIRDIEEGKQSELSWQVRLLINLSRLLISGFTGWLTAKTVGGYDSNLVWASAGAGGFLGNQIFEYIVRALDKRLDKQ